MPVSLDSGQHVVQASALGGRVRRVLYSPTDPEAENGFTHQIEGYFSRVDLFYGGGVDEATGLNTGLISVLVERWNGAAWESVDPYPFTFSTYYSQELSFVYDNAVRTNYGDSTSYGNAAVFPLMSLPFDRYRVTVSLAGPDTARDSNTECLYWLNGFAVYETDAMETPYWEDNETRQQIHTGRNAIRVRPQSKTDELRNHVVVVGGRKAIATDSGKFADINVNSTLTDEFRFAVASDPFSMHVPEASNYVGAKRSAVVFDDRISDDAFAGYVASAILHRYWNPPDSGSVEHTILPMLELRDPLWVVEEAFQTLHHLLWVTAFTETWALNKATVEVDLSSYPELPSYMPREEVDIDALFDHDGDGRGEPVVRMKIEYGNIYQERVGNADLSAPEMVSPMEFTVGSAPDITTTRVYREPILFDDAALLEGELRHITEFSPIPETIFLRHIPDGATPASDPHRVLVNHPYRRFFEIDQWTEAHAAELVFDFQEGDGTPGVYDMEYYGFPQDNLTSTDWEVAYQRWGTREGLNPFYDPYTSEVHNFVRYSFDALVSGFYRVSVWHRDEATQVEVPVAWLTEPNADPTEPERHWSYMDPGAGKSFLWDGVDNIGYYNRLMTIEYADQIGGAFEARPTLIGRGFYAANDVTPQPGALEARQMVQIGDDYCPNWGLDGMPYYTLGHYSKFFLKVEVMNDEVLRHSEHREPRSTQSNQLPYYCEDKPALSVLDWHETATPRPANGHRGEVHVWYHLSEPTQVTMKIEDWVGLEGWTPTTEAENWSVGADPDGTLRDGKPVRITFSPVARRGVWFETALRTAPCCPPSVLDPNKIAVRMTREVHLKATVFDQFWTFMGRPWAGIHGDNPANVEEKRLTSRMFHIKDEDYNLLAYEDAKWRDGRDVAALSWVFQPEFYEVDFGDGRERIRYGDYEQIQRGTNFTTSPAGGPSGSMREYITMAFVNYLFYFSAFALDRSGRRQWCITRYNDGIGERGFIDRTKIVTPDWLAAHDNPSLSTDANYKPQYRLDYEPKGADRYLVRSIYARQWVEPSWKTPDQGRLYPGSPVLEWEITDDYQLRFVQPYARSFSPNRPDFMSENAEQDAWLEAYYTNGHAANKLNREESDIRTMARPDIIGADQSVATMIRPESFGTWTFDRGGYTDWFSPSPARDFYPYWKFPVMPEWAPYHTKQYVPEDGFPSSRFGHPLDLISAPSSNRPGGIAGQNPPALLRDPAAQSTWFGRAFADYAAATDNAKYGVRVEQDVATWASARLPTTSELYSAFDYQRVDELDRFDMYRGVISRGEYLNREGDNHVFSYANYWGADERDDRVAPPQPLMPINGSAYLLNLGRYGRYHVGPIHDAHDGVIVHWLTYANQLSDIRFETEFAWYGDQYFPVDLHGRSLYCYFRREHTLADQELPMNQFWWHNLSRSTSFLSLGLARYLRRDTTDLFFDGGAWTGWKPDVSSAGWSTDPHLRWAEHPRSDMEWSDRDALNDGEDYWNHGGDGQSPYMCTTPEATGRITFGSYWHGTPVQYRRQNILDEAESHGWMRLAVGPATPNERPLIMNLTLPRRLGGF